MRNNMLTGRNGKQWRRINRRAALNTMIEWAKEPKNQDADHTMIIVPCNCSIASAWSIEINAYAADCIERGYYLHGCYSNAPDAIKRGFDSLVNEFEYYDCNNQLGRYAAFYVQA